MLKHTITYKNLFTDEEVTEEHYFHISKADLIEMEMTTPGGMEKRFKEVSSGDNNGAQVMALIQDILRQSYGKKEGNSFVKSNAIWDDFRRSEAYSQFFFDLCTDTQLAVDFINRVFPTLSAEELAKAEETAKTIEANGGVAPDISALRAAAEAKVSEVRTTKDPTGLAEATMPQVLTKAEVEEMDPAELKSGLAEGRYKLS